MSRYSKHMLKSGNSLVERRGQLVKFTGHTKGSLGSLHVPSTIRKLLSTGSGRRFTFDLTNLPSNRRPRPQLPSLHASLVLLPRMLIEPAQNSDFDLSPPAIAGPRRRRSPRRRGRHPSKVSQIARMAAFQAPGPWTIHGSQACVIRFHGRLPVGHRYQPRFHESFCSRVLVPMDHKCRV